MPRRERRIESFVKGSDKYVCLSDTETEDESLVEMCGKKRKGENLVKLDDTETEDGSLGKNTEEDENGKKRKDDDRGIGELDDIETEDENQEKDEGKETDDDDNIGELDVIKPRPYWWTALAKDEDVNIGELDVIKHKPYWWTAFASGAMLSVQRSQSSSCQLDEDLNLSFAISINCVEPTSFNTIQTGF